MKSRRFEDYGNTVQRLYCRDLPEMKSVCRNVTFQITNACNLQCSYCYEHHKSTEKMTLETGKKIVDYLLDLYEKNDSDFINQNTRAVVLDFIGGEPLLEAPLIKKSVIIGLRNAGGAKFLWHRLPGSALRPTGNCGSALKHRAFLQNIMS